VSQKLTRWDAIYFTKVAERGYVFEQEWAWGWGWIKLISLVTHALRKVAIIKAATIESLAGILIAHVSHGLSALVLYHLTNHIFSKVSTHRGKKLALITSLLHVFSPAGLFLSAPYTESTFALLSFSGYYVFIRSSGEPNVRKDIGLVLAGLLFGLSTSVRSNGLLNGILFAEEATRALLSLKIRRLLAAGLGGAFVGIGFLLPQVIAYQHFCVGASDDREWCSRTIPSIYTFVQSNYWDVGLFHYWTVSNIPLFLLAAPMLSILALSSIWAVKIQNFVAESKLKKNRVAKNDQDSVVAIIRVMLAIQLILGLTTLINAHVQIITRLASGYPIWYWWIASRVTEIGNGKTSEWLVRWMVMYAMIQGGLFASFLPPA